MESLFEAFYPTYSYGGYYPSGSTEIAYRATMIDRAIRKDDWALIENAIGLGWLTQKCRALDNQTVIDYCLMRGARKCALELRALGWPEYQLPQ